MDMPLLDGMKARRCHHDGPMLSGVHNWLEQYAWETSTSFARERRPIQAMFSNVRYSAHWVKLPDGSKAIPLQIQKQNSLVNVVRICLTLDIFSFLYIYIYIYIYIFTFCTYI